MKFNLIYSIIPILGILFNCDFKNNPRSQESRNNLCLKDSIIKKIPLKIKKEYPHLIDTAELFIHNADKLSSFYQKLDSLSKGQKKKLKIFHIGNSHIQADFLTGRMRTLFHKKYGNGGRGTIFPYKLAGTNGPDDIKINSNIAWNAQRNVFPKKPFKTGISGITLVSKKKEFFLEVGLKKSDSLNNKFAKGILFHNISTKENPFDFYISTDSGISEAVKPKRKVFHHKIQKGESLSTIASKNNVTVMQLKRWNDLDKNNIYAGEKLKYYKVADKNNSTISNDLKKLKPKKIKWKASGFMEFKLKKPQNSIILRYKAPKKAELNGIYLENNNPGLVYSMIGVNGAKFEHYNKSEKFFPQFDQLNKDLVIIALGTNEALDRNYTKEKIRKHMKTFYTKLKNSTDADILFCTNPDAYYYGKKNKRSADMHEAIVKFCEEKGIAYWDTFRVMKGLGSMRNWYNEGLANAGLIHFNNKGYKLIADLFYYSLMKSRNDTGNTE